MCSDNDEIVCDTSYPIIGNDTKDDFCQGMRRLLDVASDLKIATVPVTTCRDEPMTDDISSILDLVKQKYPTKFDKVKKALIEKD